MPLAGDSWTADVSAETAVHVVRHPAGAELISTIYTEAWAGRTVAWKYDVHTIPWPGDAGAPFEKIPMVMATLHATGEVGLVGFAELPQPDSIAANARHTGIRIDIRNLPLLNDQPTETPEQC